MGWIPAYAGMTVTRKQVREPDSQVRGSFVKKPQTYTTGLRYQLPPGPRGFSAHRPSRPGCGHPRVAFESKDE